VADDRDVLAKDDMGIIDECRRRYHLAQEAEQSNRAEALNDLKFANGEQWEPYLRDERFNDRRPYLTINLTDAVVRRVCNACRENIPRIKIHPVGDGADVESAKLRDGVIRHIETSSGADYAYDVAVENAIRGGWGWLGVDGDYVSHDSFDQELKILAYPNPFQCYADPGSRAPDGSDMEWFIESEMMSRVEYREKFGADDSTWNFMGQGDNVADWLSKEEVRVAKYWRVERKDDELYQLSDGRSILKSKFNKAAFATAGIAVIRKRATQRRVVKCYLLSPERILERSEWPGTFIPRVPVYGRRLDVNGRIELKGMVRDLRDVARMYNYAQTAKTEVYALQPKAPWLIAEGQMEGHEAAWRDANRKPIVAIPYKPVQNPDGSMAPPPERQMPPQPNQGFAEWAESTKSDFFAVAGMPHEPEQDKKGEVVSGIALRKRQGLSDIAHYDFYDNLTRSLRQLGKILLELIPVYYDTPRLLRIVAEDGRPDMVQVNQPQMDPQTMAVMQIKNDLTNGRYDVTIDTGPSYQTKREESAEALLELVTGTGKMGEMIATASADKVIRQFDFADAEAIADRVSSLIPAAQAEKQLANMSSDQLRALVGGLQGQVQQLQHAAMALELEVKAKHGLEQIKQQGEDGRAQLKAHTELTKEAMQNRQWADDIHTKAVTQHNVAEIGAAAQIITKGMEHAHEMEMGMREFEHAAAESDKELGVKVWEGERGRQHESSESGRDRHHESYEAERGRQHEASEAKAGREHEASEAGKQRKHEATEAQHQRGHESRESSRDRGHQAKESRHQRGHESRQNSADRNSKP
jgi:hypothetical protein